MRERYGPLPFKLYKGVKGKNGAMRMKLQPAYTGRKDEGCVFFEMCPAIGPNIYDWEFGKISMSLSASDIGKILMFLRNSNSFFDEKTNSAKLLIYHDRGAGTNDKGKNTTSLEITKSPSYNNFFFSATHKKDGESRNARVPVSPDESLVVGSLLQSALPVIFGWTEGTELISRLEKIEYLLSN